MSDTALLEIHTAIVPSAWIDYNGHMSEGYYGVAFADASDALIDYLGLDAAYRARTGDTIYTVETHITFLRELKEGARLRFATRLLGADAKRLHVFHAMRDEADGAVAATQETMLLHFDQRVGRVTAMPTVVQDRAAALVAAQAERPWPEQAGRAIRAVGRRP